MLDDLRAHAVAVLNTVRDMKVGAASGEFDSRPQHDDGTCAVDIVVAVNQNAFLVGDRPPQALDGGTHTVHAVGVMKIVEPRI